MQGERRVTALAIALAGIFVALSAVTFIFPDRSLGTWLPVHLLFAGAAATAIGGVMPFFAAAVTGGRPAPVPIRIAGVMGVAAGASLIAAGRLVAPALGGPSAWPAGVGGLVFLGGVVAVAAATLLPLRSAGGPARVILGIVYTVALVNIATGATLATLLLLGSADVARAWPGLRAAHAWLNVFGFVSLVVAGSLLHLLPTVVGARISRTPASVATFALLAIGPALAALGFAIDDRDISVVGATLAFAGSVALGAHTMSVMRRRASWTSDAAWHRFTGWSLSAGVAWFIVGTGIALATTLLSESVDEGWQLGPLVAPIGVGWVAQVLIGAWSHLVPSVGAGSPQRHARQRRILGLAGPARVAAFNAGVAAMVLATFVAPVAGVLSTVGVVTVAAAALTAVGLLVASLLTRAPAATLAR
jgi:nitrite reductase (NO-forming)